MKPEEQKIALLTLEGWKKVTHPLRGNVYWKHEDGRTCIFERFPDYLNDLNAIHEVEKKLDNDQYEKFQTGLSNLVDDVPFETYCHWSDVGGSRTVSATASQRAEALLRTLNLWKE